MAGLVVPNDAEMRLFERLLEQPGLRDSTLPPLLLNEYVSGVVRSPDPLAGTFVFLISRHWRYEGRWFGGWRGEIRHYWNNADWLVAAGGDEVRHTPHGPHTGLTRRGVLRAMRFQMTAHKPDVVPREVPVFEVPWDETA